jgi:P27 family predicted phage terminase small subunit
MNRPVPTRLKVLRGNPGHHPLNRREPQPVARLAPCPPQLDDVAKKEWKRRARELVALGIVTAIDHTAFALYCEAYSRWVSAVDKVKVHPIVTTPNGYPILNPYHSILNKAYDQMVRLLVELGMTPSARSRVQVAEPQGESTLERFLHDRHRA